MMEKFDVIVIGAGPGGYVAAIRAAQLGMKCAVVERESLGGICLNWGCIPTKALLKSSESYLTAAHGSEYGFTAENVRPDISAIVSRSRGVASTMSKGIEYLFKKNGVSVIKGEARLRAEDGRAVVDVVREDGETAVYCADHTIIATGARAASLPFAPIDGKKILGYRNALVPESLPSTMAVIGSGAIGSELAFFYSSLGVDVTIIEFMDRILPLEDDEASAQLSRSFRKRGIKVMVSSAVKSIDVSGEGALLKIDTKKGEVELKADVVLSAVGVVPNTDNIGLENLGIECVKRRIPVNARYETSFKGVYAIGDVIATPALAHVASAEAINCVENIAGLNPSPVDYGIVPSCTYTSPQVASVGLNERTAKEKGVEYKTGKFPFTASGKATAAGEREGFVKILADPDTDKVLGASMVGENVTEMLSVISLAMKMGATCKDIMSVIFPHPTMSEAIMEAAAALHGEAVHI
ncbi:MAG: dihydrolipoyl dehydrogenase [Bacteroidetes bacterium]|uniref:Dihydrolipoyl dehydrogenase n=1 Tax=Candidatus Merdivivens pullicola TaxID=2840872 RepID=A0A9D9NGS5_9BACT|nr:dihydrolipoyl dehydrogenase [Candidatus Merdivivens pullicola]